MNTKLIDLEKRIKDLQIQKEDLEEQLEAERRSSLYPSDPEVAKYLASRVGQDLLKKYRLDDEGIWEVYGEDPNCDFGGSHHMPKLGTFKGKLAKVLEIAVHLNCFYAWGAGGEVRRINIEEV